MYFCNLLVLTLWQLTKMLSTWLIQEMPRGLVKSFLGTSGWSVKVHRVLHTVLASFFSDTGVLLYFLATSTIHLCFAMPFYSDVFALRSLSNSLNSLWAKFLCESNMPFLITVVGWTLCLSDGKAKQYTCYSHSAKSW